MDARVREAVLGARRLKELIGTSVGKDGATPLFCDVSQIPGVSELPRTLVMLLEDVVRRAETDEQAVAYAEAVLTAGAAGEPGPEVEFMPSRVLFQDFTGVPVFVDFAAMRDEVARAGSDPSLVNPHIPCTLVIDHSVIADSAGSPDSLETNLCREAERNRERFAFLKWSGMSFDNVSIVPPGVGICHQLDVERISPVVGTDALAREKAPVACFDTLVGTDSHTTTVNGIGVLGWGVGGIEAEAAALGQPISMLVPSVVELHLTGTPRDDVGGMDIALTVAQLLRAAGVVGCFVEATGEGVAALTPTQRACIANMTPEYGATSTFFPVDDALLDYLHLTGRSEEQVGLVRAYWERQGLLGPDAGRRYARTVELDLATVEPSLAGPSRPHDRVSVAGLKGRFEKASAEHGHEPGSARIGLEAGGERFEAGHGTIAIAAITSCTTATDPAMMVEAGLVARRAVELGIRPKPWVKRILAPGSHAATRLLGDAGLLAPLGRLGFFTCGYGCMTCIGNSGDILPALRDHAQELELTSVLSGNRNFEGRISPYVSQNYLCRPALVVAYALAGTMDVDLASEPVAQAADGSAVMLSDLLPAKSEIEAVLAGHLVPDVFEPDAKAEDGGAAWGAIGAEPSDTFAWDEGSTYVRRPPYFDDAHAQQVVRIEGARVLAYLGDFVTTDHISPAGSIAPDSPAARYLESHGVEPKDFNTYGSRRGNHEVMMRGTFANVKLENRLAEGRRGGWTRDFLSGEVTSIFDAAEDYRAHAIPTVVLAGKLYGSGSSRDWAGKGPALLGVRAVIAESFERIHRSNLVGMGVLPLQLPEGVTAESLGLDGTETFAISPIDLTDGLPRERTCEVVASREGGYEVRFECVVRVDTPSEGRYLAAGGILPYVAQALEGRNR
jgi:aconitate hydratase